jgi:nucleotide-binding universal stress UspA family protein
MEMERASHHEGEVMRPLEAVRQVREDHMRQMDAAMAEKMKVFLAGVPFPEVPATPLLKEGEPSALIIHLAESSGADLIVIGAHSKRSFLDVLLGGTASYVSRHAPCPVTPVHPREQRLSAQSSEVGESLRAAQVVQPA